MDQLSDLKVLKIPRQTKFLQMPEQELSGYLAEVELTFDKNWLEQSNEHRVQQLWQRSDSNSTIEIVSLGYALKTLRKSCPEWLRGCLNDITSKDWNRQNGSLLELNLIAWLVNAGMNVLPAKYATPGLDATIKFIEKDDLSVSIKNHDISHHEKNLQSNCDLLRKKARTVFSSRGYSGVVMTLTAKEFFDSPSTWKQINDVIESWPSLEETTSSLRQILPGVHLGIAELKSTEQLFASGFFSDSFAAFIPYHKNEQPNFIAKINDAVLQLKNQCGEKTGYKACFIRVHQTADIVLLAEFASNLVNDQTTGVDLIILYQPAYTNDPSLNQTTPSLYMSWLMSPKWKSAATPINFQTVIGEKIMNPSALKMVLPDGSLGNLPANHYCYSTGRHFIQMKQTPNGEFTLNLNRRPNLSVFPIFDGVLVEGLLPPNDNFLIL